MKSLLVSIIALAAFAFAPHAHSAGWVSILKNTPAEMFDDEDIRIFLVNAQAALNAEGPASELAWANPKTGAGGRFLELNRTVSADGSVCKRMRFWMHTRTRSEKSAVWTMCRIDDRWRVKQAS